MKGFGCLITGALCFLFAGCASPPPVQNVYVPPPQQQSAYQPVVQPKPMPPPPPPPVYIQPAVKTAFVAAYQTHGDPRLMVAMLSPQHAPTYTAIHATMEDFDAIGVSVVGFLSADGQVDVQSSTMAKQVLGREKFLRLQNGDPTVLPLLNHQLETDILVEIEAKPTAQANSGSAVRLLAQAVSTTDGRILGTAFVDIPLPMTKGIMKQCTGYLAGRIMRKVTQVWNGYNPITVRIYSAGSVGDVLKVEGLVRDVPGVRRVDNRGITGSSTTAYGQLAVLYDGSPSRFYHALKHEIRNSSGLQATDIQSNTVDMQITGPILIRSSRQR